jgi:hypothetical protein
VEPPLVATRRAARPPRKRGWLRWAIPALVLYVIFFRRDAPQRERQAAPAADASPSAAGPETEEARDARLQVAIIGALQRAPETRGVPIAVTVSEGEATISGVVATQEIHDRAEEIAAGVVGVGSVDNEIEVDPEHAPPPIAPVVIPSLPDLKGLEKWIPKGIPPMVVQEMVREGHKKLEADQPDEALRIFQGALALDPGSREAREGLQAAAGRLRDRAHAARDAARAERERQRNERAAEEEAQREAEREQRDRGRAGRRPPRPPSPSPPPS